MDDHNSRRPWHSMSAEEVCAELNTSPEGLSDAEAAERLRKNGRNELRQKPPKTTAQMLKEQITDPMVIILIGAAAVSALLREWTEACVIAVIVALNAVIGIVQEKKAQSSLEALRRMSAPLARVMREGEESTLVVLIHDKAHDKMDNFMPSAYGTELDGKAFKDNLGEFTISPLAVENMVSKEDFMCEVIAAACQRNEVKRLMIVPDDGPMYDSVRHALRHVGDDKRVTVFAMQPMPGGNFRQEILGYSLMSALGIRAEELKEG